MQFKPSRRDAADAVTSFEGIARLQRDATPSKTAGAVARNDDGQEARYGMESSSIASGIA